MACTSVTIIFSSPGTLAMGISHKNVHLSFSLTSGKGLCGRTGGRKAYSENHLYRPANLVRASSEQKKLKRSSPQINIFSMFQLPASIFPSGILSFLFDREPGKEDTDNKELEKRANWVERLFELRDIWKIKQQAEDANGDEDVDDEEGCEVEYDETEAKQIYNQETFSRLLSPVAWSDARQFAQLAFLCNMAYVIPEIKAEDLKQYYGLKFVTSSLEKKAQAAAIKAKLDEGSDHSSGAAESGSEKVMDSEQKKPLFRPTAAYEIAALAASYIHERAKDLLSLCSDIKQEADNMQESKTEDKDQTEDEEELSSLVKKSEMAAYVARSTMTAVVAAGEAERLQAAKDLQSLHSSPCEWFICDESSTCTRCFVIQGSDSLASWQANLFFEPTKFEGTDVIVHRGIYEAAKGILEQFMPEIIRHLNKYGDRAKLQFAGHSLGGSLSLLVSLMLLSRKLVKPSTLLPVVTFGSPFVFCGGEKILQELGLNEEHINCVMMHRDIVPRAFACNYPNHVAQVLKSLNRAFQSHHCLNKKKLLYSPIGKIFILQPDEDSSPPHPLLPPGNALYTLDKTRCACPASAIRAFINCPHPLETLSNPSAYGSDGTILRDHDSSNYLKAMNEFLRQNTRIFLRGVRRERNLLWPLLTSPSPHTWNHQASSDNRRNELITGI